MFKRIIWSINLRPVYSLTVILLFFALGSMLLLGLAWNISADEELHTAREKWNVKAIVQVNAKNLFEAKANKKENKSAPYSHQDLYKDEKFLPSQVATLTLDQADMISNLPEVKSAQYITVANVIGKNIKPVILKGNTTSNMETMEGVSAPEFQLVGVLKSEVLDEFKRLDNILVSGSDISPADLNTNNAIIEHELAIKNKLKIGDTFELVSVDGSHTCKFLVSGIFVSNPKTNADILGKLSFLSEKNKIYVSCTAVSSFFSDYTGSINIDKAVYMLKSPGDYQDFRYKTMQKGINLSVYDIYTDDSQYKAVSSQVNKAKSISTGLTVFILFSIFVTVVITITFARNQRMEEIKTLLLCGESNRRIFTQFLLENMILIVIGLVTALFISPIFLDKITHFLEVITTFLKGSSNDTLMRTGKYFVDVTVETSNGGDFLFALDLKTKLADQVGILFIGLFLCANAAVGPLWKILRLTKNEMIMNSELEETV